VKTLGDYQELLRTNFGAAAQEAAARYPAATDADAPARVAEMFADTQFNFGTRLIARAMARKQPRTWRYLFARRPPGQPDGPHHGEEVPYVFGNLDAVPGAATADSAVSSAMLQSWVAFARSGDPNGPGRSSWPRYSEAEDAYIVFGDEVGTGRAWRKEPLDFLERFFKETP
jgi:para-nitrobenzyl esterase